MAYLTVGDCTVAVLSRGIVGKKRRTYGTLTFDGTTRTYVGTTGIPLPTYEKWGFMKQVDMILFNQSVAATVGGFVYKFDKTNHSLRVYASAAITPAGSISAPVFTGVSATPTGTVSAPVFTATTHVHTTLTESVVVIGSVSQPVFTGVAATPTGTVSAPAFTGTAVALAGLAEHTNNVALGASVVLYFDAIGV